MLPYFARVDYISTIGCTLESRFRLIYVRGRASYLRLNSISPLITKEENLHGKKRGYEVKS